MCGCGGRCVHTFTYSSVKYMKFELHVEIGSFSTS